MKFFLSINFFPVRFPLLQLSIFVFFFFEFFLLTFFYLFVRPMGSVLSCVKDADHDDSVVPSQANKKTVPVAEAPLASYLLEPNAATASQKLWMQSFERQNLSLPIELLQSAPKVVQEAEKAQQKKFNQQHRNVSPSSPYISTSNVTSSNPPLEPVTTTPPTPALSSTVFFKYCFAQWSGGLSGLDEVFEQCRQVAAVHHNRSSSFLPPAALTTSTSSGGATTRTSSVAPLPTSVLVVPDESAGRPSRCDSVGGDDADSAAIGGSDEDEDEAVTPSKVKAALPELTDTFSGSALNHLMTCLNVVDEAHVLYLMYVLTLDHNRVSLANTSPSRLRSMCDIQEGTISRANWIDGWLRCGVTSLAQARSFARTLGAAYDALLLDDIEFRSFYKYVYRFLPKETSGAAQGELSRDRCIRSWRTIFGQRWPLLDYFIVYVQRQYSRSYISADQWVSLPDFACAVRYELNLLQYDSARSSWPRLMDEFVEHTVWSMQQSDAASRTSSA